MRVAVTGAGGMLAHALLPELRALEMEVIPLSRAELDVTNERSVVAVLDRIRPDAVVQCAAFTRVDQAETNEGPAFAVNAEATRYVAGRCQSLGASLVYPSTDYVFSGRAERPYQPGDPIEPASVYGKSKAAGEQEASSAGSHIIVRTSWLYGAGGRNFVDTISALAKAGKPLRVVDDQIGLPSWTGSISRVIARLLKGGARGTFHAADAGSAVSWYEFAGEIFAVQKVDVDVTPVSTDDFGAPAPRPHYSVLDCSATEMAIGEPMSSRARSLRCHLSVK